MDSMDLEREKGITILAKNTAVRHGGVTINIIDTPGHADFGGEVERGLAMVDGVAAARRRARGAAAADPVRAAQGAASKKLPVVLVINKVDRSDARIAEVVDETYELFLDLDADEHQIEFPIVYCQRQGRAGVAEPARRTATCPDSPDLEPLFDVHHATRCPAPSYDEDAPLQAHVTNLDASPYLGRLALCRIHNGTMRKGQTVAWCRTDGTIERVKLTELLVHRGARAGPDRRGRPRRHRRHRRHPRDHHRRDAGRPRRPAPAAGHHRRRAVDSR